MPSDSDIRGLTHEIEHRRIKREVEMTLRKIEELRKAVKEIEQMYRDKPARGK
jgi:CRISPR/Cas system-associated exonuclease Cas4 (RecB family)